MDGLNFAIEVADMAVNSISQNRRSSQWINLGIWLGGRFERKGSIDGLNRAVHVADIAVLMKLLIAEESLGEISKFISGNC